MKLMLIMSRKEQLVHRYGSHILSVIFLRLITIANCLIQLAYHCAQKEQHLLWDKQDILAYYCWFPRKTYASSVHVS